MEKEKVFADGFSFKRRENSPEFVVGRLSIKVETKHPTGGLTLTSIKQGVVITTAS